MGRLVRKRGAAALRQTPVATVLPLPVQAGAVARAARVVRAPPPARALLARADVTGRQDVVGAAATRTTATMVAAEVRAGGAAPGERWRWPALAAQREWRQQLAAAAQLAAAQLAAAQLAAVRLAAVQLVAARAVARYRA
jgi:hypothetical protein